MSEQTIPEQISTGQIEIQPTTDDPLLTGVEFPKSVRIHPLGFPLELATNSDDVIEASLENWSLFAPAFDQPPMRLSLGVAGSGESRLPAMPEFRSRGHLMSIVSDSANSVVCDLSRGFAFGWVTPATAADHGFLRYHFLDAAILTLTEQLYLAPIHGALIAQNGCGVVLCGESFAGKSTLAYACARSGWTFVADDGTSLVRNAPGCYGIGNPHIIRFRGSSRRFFPELAHRTPAPRANGKIGIEVFTRELPICVASGCSIDHVVFLDRRQSGPAFLERYSKEKLVEWCSRRISYGDVQVRASQMRAYRRLLGTNVWEMRYSGLHSAVACLEQLTRCEGSSR
ncbi:MAG: hypothetical protein ACRD4P_10260, partial [Bryobacteraceae bacterium]